MNYFLKDTAAQIHINILFTKKKRARILIVIYYFYILSKQGYFSYVHVTYVQYVCMYALRFYNSRRHDFARKNKLYCACLQSVIIL